MYEPTTSKGQPTVVILSTTSQQPAPSSIRNQPQSSAVAAGGFIFISAGMNMAKGLGWIISENLLKNTNYYGSWFIGVIIGAVLAAPLVQLIQKRLMLAFSCLLIFIEGILYVSIPYNSDALYAGRYLNGIAIGFALIPFIVHASEIAVKSHRGSCLAIEQYCFSIGIAIQMIYSSEWGITSMSPDCLQGILDIILSILAAACLWFFIESPIFYIRKGDDSAALNALSRLQKPQGVITTATNALLEEHKNYVREHENYSLMDSLQKAVWPLIKMVFFRSMMLAFIFSTPLSNSLQIGIAVNNASWAPTIAACLRVFGSFISLFLVDGMARKLPSIFCCVVMGSFIIAIGSFFVSYANIGNTHDMAVVTSLCLLTQFFAGMYSPFTSVYLGEAFPLKLKPYCIAICIIVEQLIQIIVINTYDFYNGSLYDCLLAQGIIMCIVFGLFCVVIPETKYLSLKEAQDRFRRLFYLRLY